MYALDVEVLSDFSCLDSIPPRLEVEANTENYETAALFARAGLSIATQVGFVLLTFVPVIRFVHSFEHSKTFTGSKSVGQDYRRARKLSLRRPISGLPGFGLVAGIIVALLAIVMMMITCGFCV